MALVFLLPPLAIAATSPYSHTYVNLPRTRLKNGWEASDFGTTYDTTSLP